MNPTLVLVALVVFAFVVSRLLHRYAERIALVSGIEYAIVGVLIGPATGFDLLDEDILVSLELLITLLLGLLGFMVGLRAREAMRRFEHFMAGSVSALAVALVVAMGLLGLIQALEPSYLSDENPVFEVAVFADSTHLYQLFAADDALWLALTLGAAAAIASTTAIQATAERWSAKGPPVTLLLDMAVAAQLMAVLIFGIALAGDRAVQAADSYGLSVAEWALLTAAAGAITGLLFTVFIGGAETTMRMYVASIGVVIFASGIGSALGVSPLFVNMVAGLTVALTSPHGDRLVERMVELRRPVAILLLVFAGVAWRPPGNGWLWLIAGGYLVLRVGARLLLTKLAVATFVHGVEVRRAGAGLVGQGPLAAAIALSYAQGHPNEGPLVLSAVLAPMLLTDIFAVRSLRGVLANAGAIRPRAKQAARADAGPESFVIAVADQPASASDPGELETVTDADHPAPDPPEEPVET